MSCTEIYCFTTSGERRVLARVPNSFRGAMAVWLIMEERYLPPFIPEHVKVTNWYRHGMDFDTVVKMLGYKPSRLHPALNCNKEVDKIWNLFEDEKVTQVDRIVLGTTFDNAVVMKKDFQKVIDAFETFKGKTSLDEQSYAIKALLNNNDYIAIAWNQTDVNVNSKGNLFTEASYWYLFKESGELNA